MEGDHRQSRGSTLDPRSFPIHQRPLTQTPWTSGVLPLSCFAFPLAVCPSPALWHLYPLSCPLAVPTQAPPFVLREWLLPFPLLQEYGPNKGSRNCLGYTVPWSAVTHSTTAIVNQPATSFFSLLGGSLCHPLGKEPSHLP